MESAVVVNLEGQAIYWHLPEGRSVAYLPDSRNLWDVIWENRDNLKGIAHSHPGGGTPGPSHEDVTTFAAVEAALGKRLTWWIMSRDQLVVIEWAGPGKYDYRMRWRTYVNDVIVLTEAGERGEDEMSYEWVDKLHKLSYCAEPKVKTATTDEQKEGDCHGEV